MAYWRRDAVYDQTNPCLCLKVPNFYHVGSNGLIRDDLLHDYRHGLLNKR